jgi:Gpi18-like mannosyltransferase
MQARTQLLQPALQRARGLIEKVSPETRHLFFRATLATFIMRVIILMAAYAIGYGLIHLEAQPVREIFRQTLDRWDAFSYKIIAEHGYPSPGEDRQEIIVFLPLFPYLTGLIEYVIPSFLVAGMLISAIASVFAGYFIQALVREDGGDDADANRSLWFFFVFPTAYFLALPYTEAIFMALLLGSFYNARRGNWLWAGVLGGFCTATRLSGVILGPALAVEALHQGKWRRIPWRSLYLVLVPTGFLVYLWLNYHIHGDIFAFLDFQKDYWNHERIMPWENLRDAWNALHQDTGSGRFLIWELLLISTILVACLLAAGVTWLRPSYQVFGWLTLAMLLSLSFQISMARYVLTIFPIYFVLARFGRNATINQGLLTGSTLLMGVFYAIYATSWGF